MPSTFSDILRLELQDDGEKENTWGQGLNDAFDKLETAIAGRKSIVLSSSDVTLTVNDGGDGDDEQAAAMILDLSGTVTAAVDVVAPNKPKLYLVHNGCTVGEGDSVNIRTAAGDPLEISEGESRLVWCDGDDNFSLIGPALSTIGSFECELTGFTGSNPTGTIRYTIVDSMVTLYASAAINGTSNTTGMAMNGAPVFLRPAALRMLPCLVVDDGDTRPGAAEALSTQSTINLKVGDPTAFSFAASGVKGIPAGWSITYALLDE